MKKVTFKRIIAHIVDYIIVALIASMFARVPVLNPNYDKYVEESNKYIESIISKETKQVSNDTLLKSSYNLTKLGVNLSVITLVVSALYFVGFQYLNKGQTIGKKLFKIRIVDDKNERPTFVQVLFHSSIINSLITSLISIIALVAFSKGIYITINEIVQIIDMGLIMGSLGCMIIRADGKGIHNLLAKTNVIGE